MKLDYKEAIYFSFCEKYTFEFLNLPLNLGQESNVDCLQTLPIFVNIGNIFTGTFICSW